MANNEELQKDIGTLLTEYASNPEEYSLVETVKEILGFVERHSHPKLVWFILDEIATMHSATHCGSGSQPCPICDRAIEAMRLLPEKPNHAECRLFYEQRK